MASRKRKTTIVDVAITALAALLATALPVAAETPSQKADALLNGLIETNDPGLAVLVAQDGKILFERAMAWPIGNIMCQSSRKPRSASAQLPGNSPRRQF